MPQWNCGRHTLVLGSETWVMGIVNATPDSFSGDGRLNVEKATEHALQLLEEGAGILDIGGESTRPGAEAVNEAEELSRVAPLIERLAAAVDIPISVDTTKAAVARQALAAGAGIINDISAATADGAMLDVLAGSDCGCILMHRRGTPQTMGWSKACHRDSAETVPDIIAEVAAFFEEQLVRFEKAGIARERLCLDPGFGFGKSYRENLELIRRGAELRYLGCPLLSATSRKSTIGKALGDVPVEERLWGTAATVALAIANGCDIIRVHDVRAMRDVAKVTDAIVRGPDVDGGIG